MEEDEEEELTRRSTGLVTDLKKLQPASAQVQHDSFQNRKGEIFNGYNDDQMFLQGDFSFRGLLEGKFDTFYTPDNAKRKGLQEYNLPGEGHYSGEHSDKISGTGVGTSQYFATKDDEYTYTDTMCTDDPWTRNLFEDMDLDEVVHPNSSSTQTTIDQRKTSTTSSNKDSENKPATETEQRDIHTDEQQKKLDEDDIETFLENEKEGADEENDESVLESLKPEVGMTFKTREEGQNFFNTYSFAAGFSVAIVSCYQTTSKKRNNEIIRATMKCNKYGQNTEIEREQMVAQRQSTVIAKTDCKTEMVIAEKDGMWRLRTLRLEHNHALDPHSRFFRSHAYMTKEEKAMIRSLKQSNIPTRQIVSVLAHLRGGSDQLPYNKKKVSNYSTSINRELSNSDMMEVLSFFDKKQEEDPRFYSSFDLDSDNKVKSVFWADAKARSFYEKCGDCISFDTTFLTNKYNLPFAPIVGVSPHGNTYLFACALIGNERASDF
ncbi:protein FAR1-RELATED SEQUENCE 5-like [Lolium rigidum]|uniref:protein FAR1-RELATED SEQUENCE 5-like n=1 Tax=Lolium rigidum TaxID=89674 RepID=UPI001F5C37B3|nr:protein FAR1-RELATED SEQUENCE 5-like [Lolium rigidum]